MNIPSGWKLKHMQDDFETFSGGTPNTKNAEYYKGTIPWIRSTEINQKIITETEKNISLEGLNNSSAKMVYPGYVLLALYGATAGEVAITNIEGAINQAVLAINAKNNDSSNDYLYHYLSYHKDRIINKYVQGGQPNLSGGIIKNLLYLSPPRKEQQKIASILSTWDEAISMYSQLLDLKKSKKKHYLQYIFLDLTYFSKQNIKYDKQPLGDIAFTQSGGTPLRKNKEYYNGNIPWAVITDMTSNNKYLYETKETITDLGYKNSNVKLYEPNTILYAMYASIGECVITKIQTTANQAILNIKPIDTVDVEYLYYYLISIKEKVRLQGQQGTQSNLNAKMVREMRIPIPSKEVQLDIANFLRLLDDELELIEKLIEQLQEQKRGLMQLLLTGKVRVYDEASVDE